MWSVWFYFFYVEGRNMLIFYYLFIKYSCYERKKVVYNIKKFYYIVIYFYIVLIIYVWCEKFVLFLFDWCLYKIFYIEMIIYLIFFEYILILRVDVLVVWDKYF